MRGRLVAMVALVVLGVVVGLFSIQTRRTANTEVLIQDLNKQTQQLTGEILQLIDGETEWIGSGPVEYLTFDPDSTPVIWRVSTFYESSDGQFTKGEHTIFDELVMKAFGFYDAESNQKGHWIQVEKDGAWYTVQTEKPEMNLIKNAGGKVVGVEVVLRDENGSEVVRRFVGRKLETELQNKQNN